jgi:hypothetical protein
VRGLLPMPNICTDNIADYVPDYHIDSDSITECGSVRDTVYCADWWPDHTSTNAVTS